MVEIMAKWKWPFALAMFELWYLVETEICWCLSWLRKPLYGTRKLQERWVFISSNLQALILVIWNLCLPSGFYFLRGQGDVIWVKNSFGLPASPPNPVLSVGHISCNILTVYPQWATKGPMLPVSASCGQLEGRHKILLRPTQKASGPLTSIAICDRSYWKVG